MTGDYSYVIVATCSSCGQRMGTGPAQCVRGPEYSEVVHWLFCINPKCDDGTQHEWRIRTQAHYTPLERRLQLYKRRA